MTQDDDIKALRDALAGRITPGEWFDDRRLGWAHPNTVVQAEDQIGTYREVMRVRLSDLGDFSCTVGKAEIEWANAAYIAAANPARIARLLDRLEAAEAWRQEAKAYLIAAADGSMSRNNSEQLAVELLAAMQAKEPTP